MVNEMANEPKAKKLALGAGLITTGVIAGALFSPIGLAGAQDSESDSTDDTTADSSAADPSATDPGTSDADGTESDDSGRHGHGRFGRLGGGEVLEGLGLTDEMIDAGREADQSLAQIAEANGVSTADLTAALLAAGNEHLAEAVTDGRITQERADELAANLEEKIAEQIDTLPSERPQHGRHGVRGLGLDALEDLGLTQEELAAGRDAGQTLAETAEANGVSEADLVDALVAAAMERADAAVESGRITQDQVDEFLGDIEEKIAERVNSVPGERGEGRGRLGRGHGRMGADGGSDTDGGAPTDGETEGASLSF